MTVIDISDFTVALEEAKKLLLYPRQIKTPRTFQEATEVVCKALELMVISKNHKYGKENITDFGDHGIIVRANDKFKRLKNIVFKNIDAGKESKIDTWGDVCGYGVVGVLNNLDWFMLEIKND